MGMLVRDRRLQIAAAAVLAVCGFMAYEGARYLSARSKPVQPSAEAANAVPPATSVVEAADIKPDAQLSRLGTASSLSDSSLRLILVRTNPGRNPLEGTAALGPDARNPQVYVAGAVLENGARLAEVHANRVMLERDGEQVELYVTQPHERASRDTNTREPSPFGSPAPVRPQEQASEITHVGKNARLVASLEPRVDPVAEVMTAGLIYEQGKLAGFQVHPATRRTLFSQLGLESGDIITAVDGHRISTDAQWRAVVDPLRSGAAVVLTVIRGGQLINLSLDGSVLSTGAPPVAGQLAASRDRTSPP